MKLPAGAEYAGPLTVTGYSGDRCLGAWNVVSGGSQAFFGRFEAGPCLVTWKLPGGEVQKKEVILEDKPVVFEIK